MPIFYNQGANIIIACRDPRRAQLACENLIAQSKNQNIQVEILDLASLKSIREFVDRIKAKLNRLDILINNAGRKATLYLMKSYLKSDF